MVAPSRRSCRPVLRANSRCCWPTCAADLAPPEMSLVDECAGAALPLANPLRLRLTPPPGCRQFGTHPAAVATPAATSARPLISIRVLDPLEVRSSAREPSVRAALPGPLTLLLPLRQNICHALQACRDHWLPEFKRIAGGQSRWLALGSGKARRQLHNPFRCQYFSRCQRPPPATAPAPALVA